MKRYEAVAEQVAERIEQGVYRAGRRIPGTRDLVKQFGASTSTVMQAQRLLEQRGLVEARPRSGYYVRARHLQRNQLPAPSKPSSRPALVGNKQVVLEVMKASKQEGVVHLGAAVPHSDFLPYRALSRSVASVNKRHAAEFSNYTSLLGHEALRQQVAVRMAEAGCTVSPEQVIITNGCHEALTLSLKAVTQPGDLVAIESPAYYGLLQVIQSLNLKVLEIPTDPSSGVSLEALQLAIEQWPIKACVMIANFSNPLGHQLTDERKQQLVSMLREAEIPLIEDDIHGDLSFDQQRPLAAKHFDREDGVLYCSSFSKTIAPGFRVGWVVTEQWHNQIEYQKFASSLATPTLPQLAIADFLERGTYNRHLREIRSRYAEQVQRMVQMVLEHFPQGTRVSQPQGGFVLWVELPKGNNTTQLYEEVLALGISITPGMLFSAQSKYTRCLRLNCALQWDDRTTWALMTLGKMAAQC